MGGLRLRTTLALLAVALGVGACGALQGLGNFEKCQTDEECGLVADGSTPFVDGATVNAPTDASTTEDHATVEAGCGDTLSDRDNCGACGKVCATGFACTAGTCTCGKTTCGGTTDAGETDAGPLRCIDTQADVTNCGGCDVACALPNAVPKCTRGACAVGSCALGFVDCDGDESNGCECPSDSCMTGKLCAKRVFTTSLTYDGNLGGLAGADAKCQARAVAASLPGTYKAWLSDAATSPDKRFTKATIPYRLVDGTLVANGYGDLVDGTLAAPLHKTELGGPAPTCNFCGANRVMVWSSTSPSGVLAAGGSCNNWTDTAATTATWGDGAATDGTWTGACGGGGGVCVGPTFVAPIYCFQQ